MTQKVLSRNFIYRKISNIRRTKSENLSDCRLVLQLPLDNALKPGVKLRVRCKWSSADRRCSNYIWVINNFIANAGAPYIRGLTENLFRKYFRFQSSTWPLVNQPGSPVLIIIMGLIELSMVMITTFFKPAAVHTLKTICLPGVSTCCNWLLCIMWMLCDEVTQLRNVNNSLQWPHMSPIWLQITAISTIYSTTFCEGFHQLTLDPPLKCQWCRVPMP